MGLVGDNLNIYEQLEHEAYENGILIKEVNFNSNSDGLYKNNKIALNKNRLNTMAEKTCTLIEELSHHHYNCGDILDDKDITNRKQEYRARLYSYNKLIGFNGLINAYKANCQNAHEFAEYLNVTVEFLYDALECYEAKYGEIMYFDNYMIIFRDGIRIIENKKFG